MTAIAVGDFSVITTGSGPFSSLRTLLGLSASDDRHIDYFASTPSQRNIWAAQLDRAVLEAEKPVLLVANGTGCHATAWWARLSPSNYVSRVAGALLFDPLRAEGDVDPRQQFASPRVALPFPSIVLSGGQAGRMGEGPAKALADLWGSGLTGLPTRRAGRGWQTTQEMLHRLSALVIERRLRVAGALGVSIDEA